jgi:Dehydratase medium subunit
VNEPLVLVLVSDPTTGATVALGVEEEGVSVTVELGEGAPDVLARRAAGRAVLGIGVGCDDRRLALVLAGCPARPYLEAPAADARAFGADAARIAARRPLRLV